MLQEKAYARLWLPELSSAGARRSPDATIPALKILIKTKCLCGGTLPVHWQITSVRVMQRFAQSVNLLAIHPNMDADRQTIINRARNCGDSLQLLDRKIRRDIAENFNNEGSRIANQKSRQDLVLLFLAELLKSWIAAQRVPQRIEPKKGRRNAQLAVPHAMIGRL